MKAAIYTQYGPSSVLNLKMIDTPKPKDNQLLVKVHAATVNRTDCGFLTGLPKFARIFYGLPKPRFPVLGCEFAGVVAGLGSQAEGYEIGDRVFGYQEDDGGFGAHAEYICVSTKGMVTHIPEGFDFTQIAPATEGAHYVLGFMRASGMRAGQKILINGATGAIGSAAVQLCKQIGMDVTAVCGGGHADLVRGLGASRIVDYKTEDFTQVLAGERFDVIFDAVGKSSFKACRPLLTDEGIYTSSELGPNAQNPFLALWTSKFSKQKVRFPIPKILQSDIVFLKGLIEAGEFKPVIDREYALDDIAAAYDYVLTGEKIGNVVIRVAS